MNTSWKIEEMSVFVQNWHFVRTFDFLKNPFNEIDHLYGNKFPRSWTILLIAFSERAISLALELTWPLSSTRASTEFSREIYGKTGVVGVGTIDRESAPGAKLRESISLPGEGPPIADFLMNGGRLIRISNGMCIVRCFA